MKKIVSLLSLAICLSCIQSQEPAASTATLIANTNIIDVATGDILQERYVVIDSGKITQITTGLENTSGYATLIDGEGKYLMPGLAEMHAHIPPPSTTTERLEETLFLYLSNGITVIRGMLGDPLHLELREKALTGELLSPRIFSSSPSLNGNSVRTKEEAVQKVIAYQKAGYDFLKIHPGIQKDVFDEVVRTANAVGIPFAGHVPVDVGIRHALRSKYASIDHVDGFLEGLVPEEAQVDPTKNGFFGFAFSPLADATKIDELVALARENEVWIVPTQSLFERWFAPISGDELLKQPEMKYMPASTLANWKERKEQSTGPGTGFNEAQWRQFDSLRKALISALNKNGHGMLLGSDAPQLFNVPGFSIHHEINGMLQAGLSPIDVIRSGTLNAATFFGMSDTFGQVKVGMDADLILLNANPLENMAALKDLNGVLLQGQWLSKAKIEEKLALIAEHAAKQ